MNIAGFLHQWLLHNRGEFCMGSSRAHNTALDQIWCVSAQQIWRNDVDRNSGRNKILLLIVMMLKHCQGGNKKCKPLFLCPLGSIEQEKTWFTRIFTKRSLKYTMTYIIRFFVKKPFRLVSLHIETVVVAPPFGGLWSNLQGLCRSP